MRTTRRPARHVRPAILAVIALALSACSSAVPQAALRPSPAAPSSVAPSSVATSSVAPAALTIFAAASLKKAFTDVRTAYETSHPGVTLTIAFDASSALETQIEQGAPADVLAAADTKNPQKLIDDGFAMGPVTDFATNTLTVIVPNGDPAGIASPVDLGRSAVKVVAAGPDVPITRYADQLLDNLGREAGYPLDFATRVKANIVSREDNVAAVVSKIELGEGDAAIVYVSDARSSTRVTSVAVPASANVPATYGTVPVTASKHPEAAAAFIRWLTEPDGQAILARYGFGPPS